jgi:hypothetical protein
MQNMNSDSEEVREVIAAMIPHIIKISDHGLRLSDRQMMGLLYGLKGLNPLHVEVRELIRALIPIVKNFRHTLDPQHMSGSLYGLQNMTCEYEEVRELLNALEVHIKQAPRFRNPINLGNSLYGLQELSSHDRSVQRVLGALVPHFEGYAGYVSAQGISNAMYGMKSMSSEHEEVRNLLVPIARLITQCSDELTSHGIGIALFGMQGLSSDHEEVRTVIKAMTLQLRKFNKVLSKQATTLSLMGLQSLRMDHAEVVDLVEALLPHVNACNDSAPSGMSHSGDRWPVLPIEHVSNSLYGLRNLHLPKAWHPFLRSCIFTVHDNVADGNVEGLEGLYRTLKLICELDSPLYASLPNELREAFVGLKTETAQYAATRPEMGRIGVGRQYFADCAREAFAPENGDFAEGSEEHTSKPGISVRVESNVMLNGFIADIVLYVSHAGGANSGDGAREETIVNIEIENFDSFSATRKTFCMERDKCLSMHNVKVVRWERTEQLQRDELTSKFKKILQETVGC